MSLTAPLCLDFSHSPGDRWTHWGCDSSAPALGPLRIWGETDKGGASGEVPGTMRTHIFGPNLQGKKNLSF